MIRLFRWIYEWVRPWYIVRNRTTLPEDTHYARVTDIKDFEGNLVIELEIEQPWRY